MVRSCPSLQNVIPIEEIFSTFFTGSSTYLVVNTIQATLLLNNRIQIPQSFNFKTSMTEKIKAIVPSASDAHVCLHASQKRKNSGAYRSLSVKTIILTERKSFSPWLKGFCLLTHKAETLLSCFLACKMKEGGGSSSAGYPPGNSLKGKSQVG